MCNFMLCPEYYIHTVYQIHFTFHWFNMQFSLQNIFVELRLLHRQHSLLHKNHRAFRLKVMASSFMFQKAVYQREYQKQSWKYKSVCLVSSKCLLTVSYWVQSTGCTVHTSSQNHWLLSYNTVQYSPVTNNLQSFPLFLPNAPRKNYLMCLNCEVEVSSVPTVHMVALH